MERRKFMQQSLIAGGSLITANSLMACTNTEVKAGNSFTMDFAFHEGMFKEHAGKDFIDQIKWAYDQGFRSIEDNSMMSRPVQMQEKIGNTLAKLGMRMGVFVITSDSWHWKTSLTTGKQEWVDKMEKDCKYAIEVAKRCQAKWVTVVPGNYDTSQPVETQTSNVVKALRKAANILEPAGLIMVLEPLSDNADLFLRLSSQTFDICKAVNSPSCKILYDIYHMQRNEGNLMANIDRNWEEISYIQIGDNPGRKEPGTGEINYKNVFKHIYNKGYRGIMGMEHGNSMPGKEGELALIKAYREVDMRP
ncbi:MAG: TIM barrel protein [Chitinophagaceae bacterium]|nr:TIM barrel protein [Chitinophagaceae bacterium]